MVTYDALEKDVKTHGERIAVVETRVDDIREDVKDLVGQSRSTNSWIKSVFGGILVLLLTIIADLFFGHKPGSLVGQ